MPVAEPLRGVLAAVALSAAGYLMAAMLLVVSQRPPRPGPGAAADPLGVGALRLPAASSSADAAPTDHYSTRAGDRLPLRRYPSAAPTDTVLILLHGSGWHSLALAPLARTLSARGAAHVLTPDLRGHGFAPTRRGDVDYLGQLEDDVADLVGLVERERPGARIVLGGHSSGGGLVVRFAGGRHRGRVDGYVLMAPYLRHDAPTTRRRAGGWAWPAPRRIAGLAMLQAVGVRALGHLPVVRFAMPPEVMAGPLGATATLSYSFRLNASYAPRPRYGRDLAAMRQPFALVAGGADASFVSERYEPTLSRWTTSGSYRVVPGVGHLEVLTSPEAADFLAGWLAGAGRRGG